MGVVPDRSVQEWHYPRNYHATTMASSARVQVPARGSFTSWHSRRATQIRNMPRSTVVSLVPNLAPLSVALRAPLTPLPKIFAALP